ncbi:hypothetical protein LCGC14_0565630 [marine sediment metagenome]|uniref:Uncharacterized protein n=1 Tax=marine sediment metagenome TaxID=412755 RepID=A0A0F9U728_9ZZZZ
MLIAQEDKERLIRGIFGQTPTLTVVTTPAASPTLVYSPTATPPVTPTATTYPTTVITPTPQPAQMPPITADVAQIVRHNLEFSRIPIMPGTVRGDLYDGVVNKSIIDILSVEYIAPKKARPPGITYDDLKARNREAVLSYMNSLGLKRGSTTQSPDFISTAKGTSPIPYSQERQWWASTDKERAEWAVKAVMADARIGYTRGGTLITTEQAEQILAAALRWLQAVSSDPVFVRDAGDRRDMQIAIGLINLSLLGNMGIRVGLEKPDWQERARAAAIFWLDRASGRTMTAAEYTEYLQQATNTALYYWKTARDAYTSKGGAIASPSEGTVRAYVDGLLKQAITIQEAAPTPTMAIQPVTLPAIITTTPATRPTLTPTATPAPTVTASATQAARSGLSDAIAEGNYRSSATGKRYGSIVYFYLPADLYDQMIEDAISAAKRFYADGGGDPTTISDEEWRGHVAQAVSVARFLRQQAVSTPTPIIPIAPGITPAPTPTPAERISLMDSAFAVVLPKFGLAQRYPTAYYIPDNRRREVIGEIVWEGSAAARAVQRDPIYAVARLNASDVDQEMRERNIMPESEYTEATVATPVAGGDAALREWAKTAPVFESYQQCRTAAEDQVGRVPDRWRDCLTEADMIDQAVSHALIQRGIRPYPGSLELPEAAFDSVANAGYAITQQMVYQRTYTPVVGGKILELAR